MEAIDKQVVESIIGTEPDYEDLKALKIIIEEMMLELEEKTNDEEYAESMREDK